MLYVPTIKYNIVFLCHELSLMDVFSAHTSAIEQMHPVTGTGHFQLLEKAAVIFEYGCGYNSIRATRSEECMFPEEAAAIKVSAFLALLSLQIPMCGKALC